MVFGFVFAIIVIGFLLAGGLPMIQGILSAGEAATHNKNIEEFKKAVEGVYFTTTGSTDVFTAKVTGGIERICFLNPQNPQNNPRGDWFAEQVVQDLIQNKSYSLFVINQDGSGKGEVIERLSPDENFCIKTDRELLLVNKGRSVHAEVRK